MYGWIDIYIKIELINKDVTIILKYNLILFIMKLFLIDCHLSERKNTSVKNETHLESNEIQFQKSLFHSKSVNSNRDKCNFVESECLKSCKNKRRILVTNIPSKKKSYSKHYNTGTEFPKGQVFINCELLCEEEKTIKIDCK